MAVRDGTTLDVDDVFRNAERLCGHGSERLDHAACPVPKGAGTVGRLSDVGRAGRMPAGRDRATYADPADWSSQNRRHLRAYCRSKREHSLERAVTTIETVVPCDTAISVGVEVGVIVGGHRVVIECGSS